MNKHTEERNVIRGFRGYVEDCLQHFATTVTMENPENTRRIVQLRKHIAKFCGVCEDTVISWIRTSTSPTGSGWVKLACYLDTIGYKVIELERSPKELKCCVELIGLGLSTAEKLAKDMSYSKTHTLYSVLKKKRAASPEKRTIMWNVWKEKREEIEKRKERVRKEVHAIESSQDTRKKAAPKKMATVLSGQSRAAINIMKGLLALLESGTLDELATSNEPTLRKAAGETIMRISAHLNRLNSKLVLSKK